MSKQAHMVCVTFRSDDKPSPLRYFGLISLIDDAKKQNFDGDIAVAIIDSSASAHPFFEDTQALREKHNIIYVHAPSRNKNDDWRQTFHEAAKFIPKDEELQTQFWQEQQQKMKDMDNFVLFDKKFKDAYKGLLPSEFMALDRPAIGMKKNFGIGALTETYGEPQYIIFCDDDDRHHPEYVTAMADALNDNDFARLTHWQTLSVGQTQQDNQWGIYDVGFYKDSNGNWVVPEELEDVPFRSTLKNDDGTEFRRLIGEKFCPGMLLSFPPLGHDGALQSYHYDTWTNAVATFGGCAPTSMCEDMIFYRNCMTQLSEFNAKAVQHDKQLFVRCADGSNASLIEWNIDQPDGPVEEWSQQVGLDLYRNLRTKFEEANVRKAGQEFVKTGKVNWDTIFPKQSPTIR